MKTGIGWVKAGLQIAGKAFLLAGLFCCLLPVTSTEARDVSFIWSPNPETVDGYRIYYKTGASGPPYNGTGAVEGPSPVVAGNVSAFTLHGLSDTATYYFALTAYLGSLESTYSTEIVLPPTPPGTTGRSVSFVWLTNPEAVDGYRLYYKDIALGSSCPLPADVPYNGQDATAGPSPLDTGNVTAYAVQGLSYAKTYCFALTAYKGTQESGYTQPLALAGDNPPVANAAVVSTQKNTPVSGQLTASDADGDALIYSIVTNGSKGTALVTSAVTGAFTYTPASNVTGSDAFTFKVNDGKLDSNIATVSVTIATVNTAPTATGGYFITDENTPASGTLMASDPDGDPLTYSIVTNGSKGTALVTNAATGAFTYTPTTNATGSDSFTFRANDGTVNSNTATVSVTINAVNVAPVATGFSISTDENKAKSAILTATDGDGDPLTYSIVTNGSKGTALVTNAATGAFTYTPTTNATGSDSFTFRANDGTVNSNTATVSVTINAVNVAPVATGFSISTDENKAYSGTLRATDGDNDPLTYSIVTNGGKGTALVTNAATGAFTYTPTTNATGSDSFTFRANDGTVNSNTATVSVTINAVNVAPVASANFIDTDVDTPVNGQLLASDPDNDPLTYSIITNGTLGTVAITNPATGSFTYTPNPGATGQDTFTFKVNDGTVDSNAATVNVLVKDGATVAAIFGNTPDSDYPGTIADTFANINTDINAAAPNLETHSWSSTLPHKVANTIIVKADLANIPSSATILEARLYLYQTGSSGEAGYRNTVHRLIGKNPIIGQVTGYNAYNGAPWTPVPAGTTYNNIPLGLADIDAEEDGLTLDALNGYRSWKVTAMVQQWVREPATNFGLLIKGVQTPTQTGRVFAATENQSAAIRPKLVVQYTLRPPAPRIIMIEEIK